MVPRDLPSTLVHMLEPKIAIRPVTLGSRAIPVVFFLIFYHLTLNLTLNVNY